MRSRLCHVAFLLYVGVAIPAWPQSIWVSSDLYDQVSVVLAANAPAEQKHAAEVFLKYWKITTGHDATISPKPEKRVNVWIGRSVIPEELLIDLKTEGLGPDGFILDTLREPAGEKGSAALQTDRHLLALGGKRGIVYAIYHFFEEYMGVRWLAPGVLHVPEHAPPALPEVRARIVPCFEYRYTDYAENADDPDFREAHKLLQKNEFGAFAHTAYDLVPPEKFYAEHPEYYSLVDAQRRAPASIDWRDPREIRQHPELQGQLCFSNPQVAAAIAAELRARIKENPEPKIWSVSQMDWGNYCECDGCQAIDQREGTHAGALLTCVNRVARALKSEFPEHRIETLAYQWSRRPPRQLAPEPNVIVRLCTAECDFARPLTYPKFQENVAFQSDIAKWAELTNNLYIWDYAANLWNFQLPHPNVQVIQPNMQFFKERGAIGVFEQGCPAPGGEFAELRQYLVAKCLWQPDADGRALASEFIDLFYGPAAPGIKEYLALMSQAVLDSEVPMTCFDTGAWMDFEVLTKAQDIFKKASEAVGDQEPYKQRLGLAYVPVQYASLICPPELKYSRYEVTVRRPPSPTLEEYLETLKGHGVTQTVCGQPFEAVVDQAGGTTPSRRVDSELRVLENEYFLIWVAPSLQGSVIRWHDKKNSLELLRGFQSYGRGPGTLQDWTHKLGEGGRPLASPYKLISQTLYALTLETTMENGLNVKRVMELRPATPEFTVTLILTNGSGQPLAPNVKVHPEFTIPGESLPEIWLERSGRWEKITSSALTPEPVLSEYLAPFDGYRWAFRLPDVSVTLINQFVSYQIDGLYYYCNAQESARHINLELFPKQEPLAPGKSRQLKSTYITTSKRPEQF
ncbi:MAG TPA: DUF4838 domain-containing protein [Candidatus Hydrogenedentes bacterium]|nr:DUF4838 domain-containing protein [Candidatus Hydrogenedentota bacterium]